MTKRREQKRIPLLALAAALIVAGPGCVNSRLASLANQLTSGASNGGAGSSGPSGPSNTGDTYKISNVAIQAPGGQNGAPAAGATFITSIFVDTSHSSTDASGQMVPVSNHCNTVTNSAQQSKPCICVFTWPEINNASGSTTPIIRSVQTSVTLAQKSLLTCNAPDRFSTEIVDGTVIKVTVAPGQGNGDSFSFSTYNFPKNTVSSGGDFRDALGHAFENVVHYSCYEQFKRGMTVGSKYIEESNPKTGAKVDAFLANQFCVAKAAGGTATQGCDKTPMTPDFSAQAYYYNLYARSDDTNLNSQNDRFTCPTVKESIDGAQPVGGQNQLYPRDTTFSLSLGRTPDFSIGVKSNTRLGIAGDPGSQDSDCDASNQNGGGGGGGAAANTTGFVKSCLGFAAKPNPDGTCPYFRDSNGQIRFTYRLRRLIALYPRLFDTNGDPLQEPQPSDTVYVLDRPVSNPSDPLKPYTMRGPKPCPFAIFDSKGVLAFTDIAYTATGGFAPTYGATNNPQWNNTNVDGIQLPNADSTNSCSAILPLVHYDSFNPNTVSISLGTLNQSNPVLKRQYIRPIRAWAPHYEEDTSFQACAPQAFPMKDPPLHFAKDLTTGNVSWCAESYPTQNDNATAIDQHSSPLDTSSPYVGHVMPYTSHVVKNSASSPCHATQPSTLPPPPTYPSASFASYISNSCQASGSPQGYARHPSDLYIDTERRVGGPTDPPANNDVCSDRTCDRTVIPLGLSVTWPKFPLLARAPNVEQAIASDSTYGCVMTFDNNGNKTGKLTPKGGCCGSNVKVWTGLPSAGLQFTADTAHLEPDAPCLIPTY